MRIITRGLSTSANRLQLVKPPVQVYGTEGRYATALYSAASKKNALDACEKDLKTFQETVKKDGRLGDFLADPSIQKTLKAQGLAAACDKLKMNELSKNLFLSMAENGRYNYIDAVANAFGTIMAAHRGEVVCEVTTAKVSSARSFRFETSRKLDYFQALDANMKKEVEATLASFLKSGQKSLVNYKVDASIIGGMVVSIGDKFVDMSISSKMNKYTEILKSAA